MSPSTSSAVDEAYLVLRRKILDGELRPGQRLGEAELSSALGLSRTPVREAIRRLSAEGIVDTEPNRGARVRRWTEASIHEHVDIRRLLESHAARLAARVITDDESRVLMGLAQGYLAQLERLQPDWDLASDLNVRFHRSIHEIAQRPLVTHILSTIIQAPLMHRTMRHYSRDARERQGRHHVEIANALSTHSEDWAAAAMEAHIEASRSWQIGSFRNVDLGTDGDG